MIAASVLARRLRLPWVADYHDLWSESYVTPRRDLSSKASMAFERFVMRRASLIVAVSHGVAHRLDKEDSGSAGCRRLFRISEQPGQSALADTVLTVRQAPARVCRTCV